MNFIVIAVALLGGWLLNDVARSQMNWKGIFGKKENPQQIFKPQIPKQENESSDEKIRKLETSIEQLQKLTGTSFPTTENPKIKNAIDKLEGMLKKVDTLKQRNNKEIDDIITEYEKKLDDEISKMGIGEYKEDKI